VEIHDGSLEAGLGYCRAMAHTPHPIRINSAAQAACGFAPAVAADLPEDRGC
jgi:hypothetical protein